ncbi:hypothetical protein [Bacillus suaedae]|uniref:Uncharacterized protein n=1 Tax=Halalkalibacter suaedae TaxID=2822140 RepID=A0A941ANH6_9BACI|nr:hypothetical protein [Bacillus suaedae]MBP3951640.1 hypothetical protein [Bacillus suaedae]
MKVDVGYDYAALIEEADNALDHMLSTNVRDALQTDHGIALIETFRTQTINKHFQFSRHYEPMPQIGDLFYELYLIQDKALEHREIPEEDIEIYKDRLEKLTYIMLDLSHSSMPELFDTFHGNADPEVTEEIRKRIEADY